jgi:hypothetical protein
MALSVHNVQHDHGGLSFPVEDSFHVVLDTLLSRQANPTQHYSFIPKLQEGRKVLRKAGRAQQNKNSILSNSPKIG